MGNKNTEIGSSLTVYNIAELHVKFQELINNADRIDIDLNSITDCDTSGVQLLHSVKKSCLEKNKEISLKNPSAAVHEALNRISTTWDEFFK
ncbi:MAG: STAS domain-containing protein [Deltaproteobacteria bacterium]|nr:STAS domain-containing protein [Deltaproteobacteria bacterium]